MGKTNVRPTSKPFAPRYRRSGRKAKVVMRNEFCAVCGYHRKYAIRLLAKDNKLRQRRPLGYKPIYGSWELLTAIKRV